MRKLAKIGLVLLFVFCMAFPHSVGATGTALKREEAKGSLEYAKGEALILHEGRGSLSKTLEKAGGPDGGMELVKTYAFDGAQKKAAAQTANGDSDAIQVSLVKSERYSTEELIRRLSKQPGVVFAEPNYRIHAFGGGDPLVKYQWPLDSQGQNNGTAGLGIHQDQDALLAAGGANECVVAVVDTGIDYTHEDLKDVVWENPFPFSVLRGAHGYNFIDNGTDPMDDNGHGSHCSGIIAASKNSVGIEGVAKGKNVRIMALKVLDNEGNGYEMETVGAYHYIYRAQQLGVNVVAVNNSWGGAADEEAKILGKLIELVGENGAVSVCSAGNDSMDNDAVETFPACIDSPYVVSVAASNERDELAAFSNYGAKSVDLAAPGTDILSSVSYDCFNPGISENKEAICNMFEDFSDKKLSTESEGGAGDLLYGLCEDGYAKVSVELSGEEWFGPVQEGKEEQSLKWSIHGARAGDSYTIYFPYEAGSSETDMYDSVMVKAKGPDGYLDNEGNIAASSVLLMDLDVDEDGNVIPPSVSDILFNNLDGAFVNAGNYWSHLSGIGFVEGQVDMGQRQKHAIAVTLQVVVDGDYEMYLDDLAISRENVPSEEFGKYEYYNGTSMAAPCVSGAAAAIACAYPKEDALGRVSHLLGCVRKSAGLDGLVATGGSLDLSGVTKPNCYIKRVSLNGRQEICIEGKSLGAAAVTVNGEAAKVIGQSEDKIIIDSSGLLNHSLDILVSAEEKEMRASYFFSSGKGFADVGNAWGSLSGGYAGSDGGRIYFVDADGSVSFYLPEEKDETGNVMCETGEDSYRPELFGEDEELIMNYTISNSSGIAFLDQRLWTVLKLDLGYTQEQILACYEEGKGWRKAAGLPEEFVGLEGIAIAAFRGELYLMGGFDMATEKAASCASRFNPTTGQWGKAPELPEGRAFAKAVSIGERLVVTLGRNDTTDFPKNLVFDGAAWKLSGSSIKTGAPNGSYFYLNGEMEKCEAAYYDGLVGVVNGGILYANVLAEDLGDVFFYQASSDRFVPSGYSALNTEGLEGRGICAASVKGKCYLLTEELKRVSDSDGGLVETGPVRLFAMPIESPCIEATLTNGVNGILEGGCVNGIGFYMPGDIVTLTAEPDEDYFVKSFTVNGAAVPKGADGRYRKRVTVNTAGSKVTVAARFGAYVASLETDEAAELSPGQTYELTAYIFPETAENAAILWSSDSPAAVTVDANGNVTVKKTAKPGTVATITATAADRGTVKAYCKVTVVKAQVPSKNETRDVKGLCYRVTKSSAKNGTVACVGFAGKASKTVTIPAKIQIDGYTFRVTKIAKGAFAKTKALKRAVIGKNVSVIEKNAFFGCSSLRTVKIKGASLKKIGKGAFSGISKKAAVRVSKKRKKAYAAKLRSSGYQGAVK